MWIRRTLKWTGFASLGMVGLVAIAMLGVYIAMGRDLGKSFHIAGESLDVPVDAGSIEEGQRLAQLRGCSGGCHGRSTEGRVMVEMWDGTRVVAPDLARVAARYSTTDLERVIRHGVRPDGTSVIRFMPSEMFATLSDHDLGLIIAYLRSQPHGEESLPEAGYGPLARLMGFTFKRQNGSVMAAEVIEHQHPEPPDTADPAAFGRYLANTVCSECHGDDLRGAPDGSTPSLAVALAYSRDDFGVLMRTGMPLDGRKLGLMADVARSRFVRFTDAEIAALHGYLHAPGTWSE
jgi:cytochrome c553